jgi:hypothetical protein
MCYVAENYDKDATSGAPRRIGAPRESEAAAAFAREIVEIAGNASQMRHQDIMTTEPIVPVVSLPH